MNKAELDALEAENQCTREQTATEIDIGSMNDLMAGGDGLPWPSDNEGRALRVLGDSVPYRAVADLIRFLDASDKAAAKRVSAEVASLRSDLLSVRERLGAERNAFFARSQEMDAELQGAAAERKQYLEEMERVRDSSIKAALFPAVREELDFANGQIATLHADIQKLQTENAALHGQVAAATTKKRQARRRK